MKKKRRTTEYISVMLSGLMALAFLLQPEASAINWPWSSSREEIQVPEVDISGVPEEDRIPALGAEAAGNDKAEGEKAVIDYSNTSDGYVMARYTADTDRQLKVQVTGPETTYTYGLQPMKWAVFPLSDGNGEYKVTIFENVADSRYAVVLSVIFPVSLKDEFAPFLRPNQFVNYAEAPETVATAIVLTQGCGSELEMVEAVYNYVVGTLTYDRELAENVKTGYLPVLDSVLNSKTGICFDYAALMTGMLRSRGVPCKLVVGYAGDAYHAWISVWINGTGWIEKAVYFDGVNWQRMDPTFASTASDSRAVEKYIGNGENYSAKYFY